MVDDFDDHELYESELIGTETTITWTEFFKRIFVGLLFLIIGLILLFWK